MMHQHFDHCSVVIVAGGKGLRMGASMPKQFLELNGAPILFHTISAFRAALSKATIIVVAPKDEMDKVQEIIASLPNESQTKIVSGGETRFHSVKNGVQECINSEIIFVHDGVRPLVTEKLIRRCYKNAMQHGSAIPAIKVTDSIRKIEGDFSYPVERSTLRAVQTPQTFKCDLLKEAFAQDYQDNFTDEATVVEAMGQKVFLVEGEQSNIKITTPEDLLVAEQLMKQL